MRRARAWLVMAVALAGCATANGKAPRPEEPWYRTVVEPMQSDPDRIARFYDRLLTMKASELSAELATAREAFAKDKSELNRVQLALLLSLPGTSFRDDNAALALLSTFAKDRNRGDSTLRPLAMWLYSGLLELRRSDEALQQQAAKLKNEQSRSEALQEKLDAILEMEMKMIEREQTLPKKK